MSRILFVIGALVAGVLTVPLAPGVASADTGCPVAASSYAGGQGTVQDPWQIATKEQLQRLRDDSATGWDDAYELTANIDMGGCWWNSTIGDGTTAFTGKLDGRGFTISNLFINVSGSDTVYAGLIGKLDSPGTITRVKFTGSVSGMRESGNSPIVYSGGLVGYVGPSSAISYSTATGYVTASAMGLLAGGGPSATAVGGGLVGHLEGTIIGSYATGTVNAAAQYATTKTGIAGGLVGQSPSAANALISYSYASGRPIPEAPAHNGGQVPAGTTYGGGFMGIRGTNTNIVWARWDTTSSTYASATGSGSGLDITGKTTVEMKELSTYAAWPIVSGWQPFNPGQAKVWGICEGDTRAFLLWEYASSPCTSKPGAPTVTGVQPGGTTAVVSYTADDTGGLALTRVEFALDDTLTVDDSTASIDGSHTVGNLQSGMPYVVYVRAVNSKGAGPWSAPSAFVTLRRPGVPTISAVSPSVNSAVVAFTADDSGGATVTRVEFALDDTTSVDDSTTDTGNPFTLERLAGGTTYTLFARAVNSEGPGAWSAGTSFTTSTVPVPPTPTPASAPLDVSARAVDAALEAAWSPPSSSGSFPVSTYQATAVPGGATCVTSATRCTIGGLRNGTTYTVVVRALTGAGWSSASAPSNAVTPQAASTPSIAITGSRSDKGRIEIVGRSTGLEGERVQFWVSTNGRPATASPTSIIISADGTFRWSRKARGVVTVQAIANGVRSNAVVIADGRGPRR